MSQFAVVNPGSFKGGYGVLPDVPSVSSTPITQSDRRRAYGNAILEGDPR